MPSLEDVDAELDRLRQYQSTRQAAAAGIGANYNPNTDRYSLPAEADGARLFALVHDLNGYQQKYWWLKPIVQYAMSKTGIAPDAATAKTAADIGAQIEADKGFGFQPPGTSVKAGFMAIASAVSGRGAAYGGSYDWGNVQRDLSQPDTSYITHYGQDGGSDTTTLAANGVELPLDPSGDTEAGRRFLESHGVPVGSEVEAAKARAQQTIAQYAGRTDLSDEEHARLFSANRITGMTDQEYRDATAALGTPIDSVVRGGFMVLDAPLQSIQGQVRNVYAAVHGDVGPLAETWKYGFTGDPTQSDLGVAAGQLLSGKPVDVGTGFFVDPASGTHQELLRRQKERGEIGGHAITAGRWAADLVSTPDTVPFNLLSGSVDLAAALFADPANIVLAKYSKLKEADKLFTEAGGLLGLRRTVSPAAVDKFWDNPDLGGRVVDWVSRQHQFYDIWEGFNRKIPVDVAHQLARTDNPETVDRILRGLSGGVLREKPDPFGVVRSGMSVPGLHGETAADVRLGVKRSAQQYRLNNIVPMRQWDLEDPLDSVVQTERFLRNVKAPNDMVYDYLDRMAGARNRFERRQIIGDLMGDTDGLLVSKWGIDPKKARDLTTLNANADKAMRLHFVDETGEGVNTFGRTTMIGDTAVLAPDRQLLDEYIGRFLPMPDIRELRRMTSRFRPILATKDAEQRLPLAFLDFVQSSIWKPAQLLRGAWTVRVIGEEQIRMAAAGLDSIFRHPLSAIAYATGKKDSATLLRESFDDVEQWQQAMTRGAGKFGTGDAHLARTGDWVVVPKDPYHLRQYLDGLGGELAQLHNDTIARTVARSASIDDAVEQVGNGPGRSALVTLSQVADAPELLTDPAALRRYVESVQRRISVKTGDHPDLLEAVREGRLDGEPLLLADQGRTELNPKMVAKLDGYLDATPDAVKAQRLRMTPGEHLKDRYDRIVEGLFGTLMSRPTNWLSRSPAFKQFYYQRVPELMPLATVEAQHAAIAAAKAANVDKDIIKAMEAGRATPGEYTLDHLDMLAKGHALDETRQLLYDISEKSQFFDSLRLIFPFGEAWKEVVTRWAHLLTSRPQNARRLQQIIGAARGEGLGQTIGGLTGDPVSGGFFHKNERGEEVFTYPFSTGLTSSILGVPIPLEGRVSGLNMVGQIYPALGPMVSIPVAALLPDSPQFDAVRDALFPYGTPGDPADPASWAQTWMPPWMKRVFQPADGGQDNTRLYANTVMDVARYLASTGDYDLHTPEGQQKLQADAQKKTAQFNLIRGFAQWFAPSSPTPAWLVEDKTGNVTSAAILATEYRSFQAQERAGEIPSASQKFLDTYGTEPFLLMQAKTQAVSYGYPTDSVGLDWVRNNPDLETNFPNVFGYFAPHSDDPNDFSYNAYLRAISVGAKNPLTVDQFVKLGMARLASLQYDQAKAKVAEVSGGKPTTAQRAWLADIKASLIAEYPGYGPSLDGGLGLTERASKDERIREITTALNDPRIASTDAGQAAKAYLEARSKAEAASKTDFRKAKAARGIRDWLRDIGTQLVAEHPGFGPLWEQLFDAELADDAEPAATAALPANVAAPQRLAG